MVHGGINIHRLKDNATRTVLVRVAFFVLHPEKLPQDKMKHLRMSIISLRHIRARMG